VSARDARVSQRFSRKKSFPETAVRIWVVTLILLSVVVSTGCGGGGQGAPSNNPLSGNWQITLERHVNPVPPLIFTGFMLEDNNSFTGSLILGSNCQGVGPVTGTLSGTNVSLTINEFGEEISLQGTSSPMAGEFSNLAGGCTAYANTGTWSAAQVQPLTGSFHGTFTSTLNNPTLNVTGTLTQGPNTGLSTATLSGAIQTTGPPSFCSYLPPAAISGLISGTTVALGLYGQNGIEITQLGQIGQINNPQVVASPGVCATGSSCLLVTADGKSLTGNYTLPETSAACFPDRGTLQITFP